MNTLALKWGTLKRWNFPKDKEALKLLKVYMRLGSSMSAILQKDTPEQKEILCKLIDKVDGDIYLDWDDKYVSKEEAKKYVINYK